MCRTNVDLYSCKHEVLRNISVCKEWKDNTCVDPRRYPFAENPHFEHEFVTPIPRVCEKRHLKAASPSVQPNQRAVAKQSKRDTLTLRSAQLRREQERGVARRAAELGKEAEKYRQKVEQQYQLRRTEARPHAVREKRARGVSAPEALRAGTPKAQASVHASKKMKGESDTG